MNKQNGYIYSRSTLVLSSDLWIFYDISSNVWFNIRFNTEKKETEIGRDRLVKLKVNFIS